MEHRLPENHQCPNAPHRTPLGPWYAKKTPQPKPEEIKVLIPEQAKSNEKGASEGEFHFIKGPQEKKVEEPKPKRKLRYIIPLFCAILVLVSFVSYSFGYDLGRNGGYEVGYTKGVTDGAGRGYNIRDPTYNEALKFLAQDQTDKNQYNEDTYYCFHFAADVKKNAFKVGYRCGLVYIEFTSGAHAIVCFNTTDKGIIFIEPQTDEIVQVVVGKYYEPSEFWITGGTIKSYAIVW